MDDTEVIQRVLAGEPRAYEGLVRRYRAPLLRLARNVLDDPHEAEDVAQEAFLDAYLALARFDPQKATFSTWLFTIARNRCLKSLRRRHPTATLEFDVAAANADPASSASRNELMGQLDRVLQCLPEDQRFAFVLVEFVALTPAEAAAVEGIDAGTFRSRLSRAKAAIRAALQQFAGDSP